MVLHDIAAIKARVRISDLVERAGLPVARRGRSGLVLCCPFHEEKTPSCNIHEENLEGSWFYCFGCGAGGDVIHWHQNATGAAKADAIADLAAIAGLTPLTGGAAPLAYRAPAAPVAPAAPATAEPMAADLAAEWAAACRRLETDGILAASMADWRGYDVDTIRHLAAMRLVGAMPGGAPAFVVRRPRELVCLEEDSTPDHEMVDVAIHTRSIPRGGGKPYWYYRPSGVGAWPFIIGDITSARHLLICEGQWDAIALYDLMGWHTGLPGGTCLLGMRGATGFRDFVRWYPYRKDARAILFADGDQAGKSWYLRGQRRDGTEIPSMAELLGAHIAAVHVWVPEPGSGAKDLNDLTRSRQFTADDARHLFRNHFRRDPKRPLARHNITLRQHCEAHLSDPDPDVAAAARYILDDKGRPRGRSTYHQLERRYRRIIPDPARLERVLAFIARWRLPRR